MTRPVLYIVAPFATATIEEIERTERAIRRGLELGWAPIFVPFIYRGLLRDDIPGEREVALVSCEAFIEKADALLLVPRMHGAPESGGMKRDLAAHNRRCTSREFVPNFIWPNLPSADSELVRDALDRLRARAHEQPTPRRSG